ncbi:MAG: IclR family transcriptional regulator [Nostocoides sp.]
MAGRTADTPLPTHGDPGLPDPADPARSARSGGGVQSLERAFNILETLADAGGVTGLSQLATDADLPLPTIHRLVRTLVDLGYLRQEPSRQYSLGPRLIRLGEMTSQLLGTWARPHLAAVVDKLGESVNLAMLDGDEIVYIGQVQGSRNSMRMFTEVGRRTLPHSTAVGKVMLAQESDAAVRALLKRTGMPRHTDHTLTTPDAFLTAVDEARRTGYAIDDGEQELGVRCVAVPVLESPRRLALSASGPAPRMTKEFIAEAVPLLQDAAARISAEMGRR